MSCSSTIYGAASRRFRALVLLALACLAAACAQSQNGAHTRGDFALRDTSGRTVRLSHYRGQVVLLSFWATWCTPCAAELPHLDRLYQQHKDAGLVVLGISMDGPETIADVAPFVRRYGVSFPVLLDEETRVVGVYNPKAAAPYTVLIGRDGAIARAREGYVLGDEKAIEADVLALLRAPEP